MQAQSSGIAALPPGQAAPMQNPMMSAPVPAGPNPGIPPDLKQLLAQQARNELAQASQRYQALQQALQLGQGQGKPPTIAQQVELQGQKERAAIAGPAIQVQEQQKQAGLQQIANAQRGQPPNPPQPEGQGIADLDVPEFAAAGGGIIAFAGEGAVPGAADFGKFLRAQGVNPADWEGLSAEAKAVLQNAYGGEAPAAAAAEVAGAGEAAAAGTGEAAAATGRMYSLGKGLGALTRSVGTAALPAAAVGTAIDSYYTPTSTYARRTGIEQGGTYVPDAVKDMGIRALGTMQDYGNALTFGGADRLGNLLAGNGFNRSPGSVPESGPSPTPSPAAPPAAAPPPAQPPQAAPPPADVVPDGAHWTGTRLTPQNEAAWLPRWKTTAPELYASYIQQFPDALNVQAGGARAQMPDVPQRSSSEQSLWDSIIKGAQASPDAERDKAAAYQEKIMGLPALQAQRQAIIDAQGARQTEMQAQRMPAWAVGATSMPTIRNGGIGSVLGSWANHASQAQQVYATADEASAQALDKLRLGLIEAQQSGNAAQVKAAQDTYDKTLDYVSRSQTAGASLGGREETAQARVFDSQARVAAIMNQRAELKQRAEAATDMKTLELIRKAESDVNSDVQKQVADTLRTNPMVDVVRLTDALKAKGLAAHTGYQAALRRYFGPDYTAPTVAATGRPDPVSAVPTGVARP